MTRGTSAPPSRRATTCWAWRSPPPGGLRWPDWADPSGRRSTTHFTSFDDGAAGISDYLWRLFEVTRAQRFRAGALEGMRWLIARAEGPDCPQVSCSWRWTDDPSWRVAYNGVGMGQAGIVLALDAFADRTGDPRLPRLRARRRRPSAHHDRRRRAPAAARVRGRHRRDRVPLRLRRSGLHVLRAIPARPRSSRPRHRATAAGLGERAGGRRPLGRAALATRDR